MSVTDRLDSFLHHCGEAKLIAFFDRTDPQDADTFIARLYRDLHWAVDQLVEVRDDLQSWNDSKQTHEDEEALRSRLLLMLKPLGYVASAETKAGGGSTDILVQCEKLDLRWIGECKVHSNYDALAEGILQLHTRYAAGRHPDTGFLVFCFAKKAKMVMERWQEYIRNEKLCGLNGEFRDGDRELCFWSDHEHEGSGLPLRTKHIVAPLWYKPQDKSGRKARDEA
jgi:hypothetical protein